MAELIAYAQATTRSDAGSGKYFFANTTLDGQLPVSAAAMAVLKKANGTTDIFGKAYGRPAGSQGSNSSGNARPFQTEPHFIPFTGTDFFGVQSGIFVVLFPFLQAVVDLSALLSAAALMPMAVAMMTASGLAPRLAARVGSRLTMSSGIALTGTGLALLALFVSVDGGYPSILPGIIVMGFGMGLAMVPSTEAITLSLPREKQGVASALNDVTREFGTALGVAMLGAILTAGYRNAIDDRLHGIPQETAHTAREGIANAVEASGTAGPQAPDLLHAARQSYIDGWQQSMWAGVAIMGLLLVYIALRGPKNATSAAASYEEEAAESVAAP